MGVKKTKDKFLIGPNLEDKTLVSSVSGQDHVGNINQMDIIDERPLSIFLNSGIDLSVII